MRVIKMLKTLKNKNAIKKIKCFIFFIAITLLNYGLVRAVDSTLEKELGIETAEKIKTAARIHFNKRNLFLFDGIDGANQCHINALIVLQLARSEKQFDELTNDEQLFLTNNLFCSSALSLGNDKPRLLAKLISISPSSFSRSIRRSIQSGISPLTRQVKKDIIDFKKQIFNESLSCYSNGNLWESLAFANKEAPSTLPKFIGITCFLEKLKEEADIWMVLKCKTICEHGTHISTFLITPDQKHFLKPEETPHLDPKIPVIVIEGLALSVDTLQKLQEDAHVKPFCSIEEKTLTSSVLTAVATLKKTVFKKYFWTLART